MSFWKIFVKESTKKNYSSLHVELKEFLSDLSEEELIKVTCISGLLVQVAFVDFVLDESEQVQISRTLKKWTSLDDKMAQRVVEVSIKHAKELSGLENHLFIYPLKESMNQNERYNLISALFEIAAADGNVDNSESEEIRMITTGLGLGHKHFVAARAEVIQSLGALRK